jgi:hypothetical protein
MDCRLAWETEVLGENLLQRHFCPSQNQTWPDPGLNPVPPRTYDLVSVLRPDPRTQNSLNDCNNYNRSPWSPLSLLHHFIQLDDLQNIHICWMPKEVGGKCGRNSMNALFKDIWGETRLFHSLLPHMSSWSTASSRGKFYLFDINLCNVTRGVRPSWQETDFSQCFPI